MNEKQYVGDGVYVELDQRDGTIILTAEDGLRATNTIYLEPQVWQSLVMLVDALRGIANGK